MLVQKEKEDGTFDKEKQRQDQLLCKKKERYRKMLQNPKQLTAKACQMCDFAAATEDEVKSHIITAHSRRTKSKTDVRRSSYHFFRNCPGRK